MRDPQRIETILERIGVLWQLLPDTRLCQLMVYITGMTDPFYMGDEEFLKRLELRIASQQHRVESGR